MFSMTAFRLMRSSLKRKRQRTKIISGQSSWEEILFGIPQGSILGPLVFDIFACDLFIVTNDAIRITYM